MVPNIKGVTAAPNKSEIIAKVLNVKKDPKFPDKFHIELKILETKSISGPNFAKVGDKVKAFVFESSPDFDQVNLKPNTDIKAKAEFIGDEYGGKFHLHQISPI
jgi:uncharacterized FlgJ-related protein